MTEEELYRLKIKEGNRRHYLANRDTRLEHAKQYSKNNRKKINERNKRRRTESKEFRDKLNLKSKKIYVVTREKRLKQMKEVRLRDKLNLFEFLGKKCLHCGFTDHRALQIDHVFGGGSKSRKEKRIVSYKAYSKIIKENPQEYQLLCANCNWIKRHENGEEASQNRKTLSFQIKQLEVLQGESRNNY